MVWAVSYLFYVNNISTEQTNNELTLAESTDNDTLISQPLISVKEV